MNPAKRKLRIDMFEDVLTSVNSSFQYRFEIVTGIPAVSGQCIIAWSLQDPMSKWGTDAESSRLNV